MRVIAPGEGLTTFAPNKRTMVTTGTSFAAPLLAGALALAWSEVTDANVRSNLGMYLYQTLESQAVYWNIYHNGNAEWQHGSGRLDIERFLASLPSFSPSTPQPGRLDVVINGNFERDFAGWSQQGAYIEKNMRGGLVYSGNAAAVIGSRGWVSQKISGLLPNTAYTFRAYARVRDWGETATVGVRMGNAAGAVMRTVSAISSSNQYIQTPQLITLQFTTDASGTVDVYLNKASGNGPAMLDYVGVRR